jgi:hypothetical protein
MILFLSIVSSLLYLLKDPCEITNSIILIIIIIDAPTPLLNPLVINIQLTVAAAAAASTAATAATATATR